MSLELHVVFMSLEVLLSLPSFYRKYEEICAPRAEEFCFITDNTYTKAEVFVSCDV